MVGKPETKKSNFTILPVPGRYQLLLSLSHYNGLE